MIQRRRSPVHTPSGLAAWLLLCMAALPAAADPMRPLQAPAAAPEGLRIEPSPAIAASGRAAGFEAPRPKLVAIRRDSDGRWQALVGERWLGVGDRLEGQPVAAIDDNTVRLGRGKQMQTLALLPPLQTLQPGTQRIERGHR